MKRRVFSGLNAVYALAIVSVLGFGAREALASPAGLTAGASCSLAACNEYCGELGYDYGRCTTYGCQCFVRMCGDVQC